MTNIVFLDRYSLCDRDLSLIESLGRYTAYDDTPRDKVAERLADADVAIANKVLIDGQTMRRLPRLKLICVAATGMNNIDLDTAAELGIEVRNAVGYSTYSVAETTLCSALALMREVVYFDEYFKSGRYAAAERMFCYDRPTRQLRGRNWGIVGLGNIGREVARLATAFGCRVSYFSTSGAKREEEYPQLPLDELLAGSDIVSIAGAALDVFSSEPLRESPLYRLRDPYKLLASPHNAWSSAEAIDRLVECIAENIRSSEALRKGARL